MKTTIERAALLEALQSVKAGLAIGEENVEQSASFVFRDGRVFTFNEEVFCSAPCEVGITGAVPASVLLSLLTKMAEKELEIVQKKDQQLLIRGFHKKSGIAFDKNIVLPIDMVKIPSKWEELPKGFTSALDLVQGSCSTNDTHAALCCVHIAPKFVEACDNVQLCRVQIKTGLQEDALLRKDAVAFLTKAPIASFAVTKGWIHFRCLNKTVMSCRLHSLKYPNYEKVFVDDGKKIRIPRGLAEATEKAAIFTASDKTVSSKQLVQVSVENGKLTLKGQGELGWYTEISKIKYAGPSLDFAISPNTLSRIAKEHTRAKVSAKRLRIDGDNWCLIFQLFAKPEVSKKDSNKETEESEE